MSLSFRWGGVISGGLLASLLLTGCVLFGNRYGQPVQRDLAEITRSDTLRVITRNHPLTYYLYRGTRRGFDFEIIQQYAEEKGLFLEVVIPPTWSDMIPYLYEGKGDIICSMLSITPERARHVAFTHPYLDVQQVTVGSEAVPPPMSMEELNGLTILVRRGSSYEERLRELRKQGYRIHLEYHDEISEVEDPVQFVARGRAPLTVVDNTIARLEQHFYPDLEIGVAVSEPEQIGWAVRPNSPELLESLNDYLERNRRGAFFNILKQRYFDNPDRFLRHRMAYNAQFQHGVISRYDTHFIEAGRAYGIDWRLLAAQSYHESRFHPDKVSWAGAVGLMQLMPRTARAMGVDDLYDPEQNIHAGSRYMNRLLTLYSDAATEDDRYRMAIAAYNAGIGHLTNARRLASELGGDSTRWDDVADALSKLEQLEYYRREGYAFVRGRAVRRYVADVMHRWDIFSTLVDADEDNQEKSLVMNNRKR